MQGDVLSAILFILYLSRCLRLPFKTKMKGFLTTPKYADDITYASTSKAHIDELEIKVPKKLKGYDLTVNNSKTEKYTIPKPPPPPVPIPSVETILKHKNDRSLWSEPLYKQHLLLLLLLLFLSIKLLQKIALEYNYQNLLVTVEKQIHTMNH